MKKFITLALLLSLGMFAIGCEQKKDAAPVEGDTAPTETTDAPAE